MPSRPLPPGTEILDDGWAQTVRPAPGGPARAALFLDRDGVMVEEVHYLHRPDDVRLIDGAAALVGRANAAGVPVVVVTNQAGVGRGRYGWDAFQRVQERIAVLLEKEDAFVDGIFACPHHAEAEPPFDTDNHPWRKPNPGMLLAAAGRLNLDLAGSWIVGDRATDLEAGLNAGLIGGIHVLTGYGSGPGERETAIGLGRGGDGFRVGQASHIGDIAEIGSLVPGP